MLKSHKYKYKFKKFHNEVDSSFRITRKFVMSEFQYKDALKFSNKK